MYVCVWQCINVYNEVICTYIYIYIYLNSFFLNWHLIKEAMSYTTSTALLIPNHVDRINLLINRTVYVLELFRVNPRMWYQLLTWEC